MKALLPLESIVVGERMRTDLGDVSILAESILELGLLQPIVIDENRRLLAGGRRYAAFQLLHKTYPTDERFTSIHVTLHETAGSDALLRRIELEENIRRKEMNWKEKTKLIAEYHLARKREAALDGEEWAHARTAELLNISRGNVQYCILVTEALKDPNHRVQSAESLSDALRILVQEKEDAANRLLVVTSTKVIPISPANVGVLHNTIADALGELPLLDVQPSQPYESKVCKACEGTGKNSKGEVCPICHGGAAQNFVDQTVQINLSAMLHTADALAFMSAMPPESVDHIISDPPYGIDLDNIDQSNTGHIMDLDRTKAEHQVDQNLALLKAAMPLLFRVLRPGGFCLLWHDAMYWQYLYDLGISKGFSVQRWPLFWCKTSTALNQCAHTNWTKATEQVIVLRKGVANLRNVQGKNYYLAGNVDKTQFSHPFAKPPEIWEWLIRAVAAPGQIVLDPFMGTGSSIWTMAKLGIRPLGIELTEHWYNEAVVNLQRGYSEWMAPKKVIFT